MKFVGDERDIHRHGPKGGTCTNHIPEDTEDYNHPSVMEWNFVDDNSQRLLRLVVLAGQRR